MVIGLINNTLNYSDTNAFWKTCELNQLSMMNQLQKMPLNIFIFVSLALLALLFQLYILPRLKPGIRESIGSAFIIFPTACLVFATLLLSALTFNTTENFWSVFQWVVGAVAIIGVILVALKNKEKIKKALGGLEKMGDEIKFVVPKEIVTKTEEPAAPVAKEVSPEDVGYCFKCKAKKKIVEGSKQQKTGSRGTRTWYVGKCPDCGTIIMRVCKGKC